MTGVRRERSRLLFLSLVLAASALLALGAPLRAAPGGQIDEDVVVAITSPLPGQRLQGEVRIAGYAADRRSAGGSGLNERDIQIYLDDTASDRTLLDIAAPRQPSPDAIPILGDGFGQVGFTANPWSTCSFPPGTHRLFVWVSSLTVPGSRGVASVDVEVEPCPPGTLLHRDDFASQPGGVSRIRLEPSTAVFAGRIGPLYADFAAGIDARCATPGVDCLYGFNVRELLGPEGALTDSYYNFELDPPNSTFAVHYFPFGDQPGGWRLEYVAPWTFSPAIRPRTDWNRLAVIAEGDRLRLFVNGQPVHEARDSRRPWGQIGWMANSIRSPIEVEFRNLVVTTVGDLDTLGPVLRGPARGLAGRVDRPN